MSSEIMHEILQTIEAEVQSRPSAFEFEMAYQARVAIDRIRFAITHAEQFSKPCAQMREASMQLVEALDRLEGLDRRFRSRSRINSGSQLPSDKRSALDPVNVQGKRSLHEPQNGA